MRYDSQSPNHYLMKELASFKFKRHAFFKVTIRPIKKLVKDKWKGGLCRVHKFQWIKVWNPIRASKKATFIWSMWHKVVVNKWWAKCWYVIRNQMWNVQHMYFKNFLPWILGMSRSIRCVGVCKYSHLHITCVAA
jgi:hypothetical protein